MSSVNVVMLVGNLGADPEVRTTASGEMVASLSVATSRQWTGRDGQRQEKTHWHKVIVWGKQAELAQRYLAKGRKVHVQGEIEYRQWDKPDGTKGYATEIRCERLTFLDSGGGGASSGGTSSGGSRSEPPPGRPASRPPADGRGAPPPADDGGYFDDDVPF